MGRLWVVGTPIGNLQDLSERGKGVLRACPLWFVEDTRVSGRLRTTLQVDARMRVLNEHTSWERIAAYAEEVRHEEAALLTDAGTPGISDPGALLVDRCLDLGIPVDAAPGPSAVTTALSVSGFFSQRFVFLGYLPRKAGAIQRELEPFRNSPLTIVLFESPHRIEMLLRLLAQLLPDRRYCLARELTKAHQQLFRTAFPQIPTPSQVPRKGEFTLVVEGKRKWETAPGKPSGRLPTDSQ